MDLKFNNVIPSLPYILGGVGTTLQIVSSAILLGLLIGIVISLLKISKLKPLNFIADFYTSIFRGTPLILQLTIIYFGIPQITGYEITAYMSSVVAIGLNSSAYVSEIIRAGILAVDKGQTEASMALAIPNNKMMTKIILPQAFKNILPALINEFTTLTKESAVVTVIGTKDIMRRAMIVGADLSLYFETLIIAGVIYYILVTFVTLFGKWVERRLQVSD